MSTPGKQPTTGPSETQIDTTRKQQPDDTGSSAKLPHERDQSTDATSSVPHPEMEQAHTDLEKGLVDADARAKDGSPLGNKQPGK